ncbi:unnamed protein product [Brassica rapa]|uniref:Uncharacterized protein n=1 Tax=Brassica campestris TaxID=3711 RepID=A0A3P6CWR5_BRACM|nr:unnamed protein product [Brassica rapa]VDD11839.1 unnamed protein product [Brassica rapa]
MVTGPRLPFVARSFFRLGWECSSSSDRFSWSFNLNSLEAFVPSHNILHMA